jgi:ATP-dependent RNA helicase RhlB
MTSTHLSEVAFETLNLLEPIQKGLDEVGFSHCTPIQAKALPLVLHGKDIMVQAQTGTGKTTVFLLAIMTHLLEKSQTGDRKPASPRAIVVAPTRELAIQIHEEALQLAQHTDLSFGLAYGGMPLPRQKKVLDSHPQVIVGTPGRLIDCFKQGWLKLNNISAVVIDEADRMFDLGFIKQLRFLLRRMPDATTRLNILCSATLSHRVMELAYEHMNNPEKIAVESEAVTGDRIKEEIFYVGNEEKIPLLLGLLKKFKPSRCIVFVNTKRAADRVWAYLEGNQFKAAILSGDVRQSLRQKLLKQFQDGELPILVATDVAARGLHIEDVSHVINFDLPQDAEEYVHRIGRTARIGAEGEAISFACEQYAFSLPDIEKYIDHKIPVSVVDSSLLVEPAPPARSPSHGNRPARGDRNKPGGKSRGRGRGTGAGKKRTPRHPAK